jgi:thiazole synthase
MVIDAGIGLPSHATKAMELGFDAVLLNTAIAKAGDPIVMSEAFSHAIISGALGLNADPMEPRDMANPSTPIFGKAFL